MIQKNNGNMFYTLYGYALPKYLPTSIFKWISPK